MKILLKIFLLAASLLLTPVADSAKSDSLSPQALLKLLKEYGTLLEEHKCHDPSSTSTYDCSLMELDNNSYVIVYDKKGPAFLYLITARDKDNKLLWRRGTKI
jgi:hypothetical protein